MLASGRLWVSCPSLWLDIGFASGRLWVFLFLPFKICLSGAAPSPLARTAHGQMLVGHKHNGDKGPKVLASDPELDMFFARQLGSWTQHWAVGQNPLRIRGLFPRPGGCKRACPAETSRVAYTGVIRAGRFSDIRGRNRLKPDDSAWPQLQGPGIATLAWQVCGRSPSLPKCFS